DVIPLRRRVILRFLWHFPAPGARSLPCTFWVSAAGQAMGVCKFVFHEPVQRPSSAKGVIATEAAMMARPRPPRRKSRAAAARKAVRKGKVSWQLDGESVLDVDTVPWPPTSKAPTIIRLTHSNVDGPVDEADFFIRVGDLDQPSGPRD